MMRNRLARLLSLEARSPARAWGDGLTGLEHLTNAELAAVALAQLREDALTFGIALDTPPGSPFTPAEWCAVTDAMRAHGGGDLVDVFESWHRWALEADESFADFSGHESSARLIEDAPHA